MTYEGETVFFKIITHRERLTIGRDVSQHLEHFHKYCSHAVGQDYESKNTSPRPSAPCGAATMKN
jgi:hypothetical protein